MMEENLSAHVEWPPVKHAVSRFSVRKKCHKKKKRKKERQGHMEGLIYQVHDQVHVLPVF